MNTIKIKRLTASAKIPSKQTENSAGYDLYADEDTTISAHKFQAVSTGIAIEMGGDMEAQVRPRSGMALRYGVTVLNAPGTIDADYRGEIKVLLINHSDEDYYIFAGDRIAQLIFSKVAQTDIVEVTDISQTTRGDGGFGSTGR